MQALQSIDLAALITVTGGRNQKTGFKGKGGGNIIPGIGTLNAEGEYTNETSTDVREEMFDKGLGCILNKDLAGIMPKVEDRKAFCEGMVDRVMGNKPAGQ
jgi:hypothetical protein